MQLRKQMLEAKRPDSLRVNCQPKHTDVYCNGSVGFRNILPWCWPCPADQVWCKLLELTEVWQVTFVYMSCFQMTIHDKVRHLYFGHKLNPIPGVVFWSLVKCCWICNLNNSVVTNTWWIDHTCFKHVKLYIQKKYGCLQLVLENENDSWISWGFLYGNLACVSTQQPDFLNEVFTPSLSKSSE